MQTLLGIWEINVAINLHVCALKVEDAQSREAPVQRLADSIAGPFAYTIMAASATTFLFWYTSSSVFCFTAVTICKIIFKTEMFFRNFFGVHFYLNDMNLEGSSLFLSLKLAIDVLV